MTALCACMLQSKAWRDERGFTIAKSPMLRTKYRVHDDKVRPYTSIT